MKLTRRRAFFAAKIVLLSWAIMMFASALIDLEGINNTSYCEQYAASPYCYTIGPNGFFLQGTVNLYSLLYSAFWGALLTVGALLLDAIEYLIKDNPPEAMPSQCSES